MKITLITNESFIYHSYSIVKELSKKADLTIYFQGKKETQEISNWCSHFNAVFVTRKRFRNPINFFTELKFIYSLRKLKADLVWFDPITLYQIIPAKLLLKHFLVSVHDVDIHPETKDYYSYLTLKIIFMLLKKNIYVASRTQSILFKDKFGFEPPIMQLPIIDYYTFVGRKDLYIKPRKSHFLRFFFFGSIEKYKGINIFLDANEILLQKKSNFEINIYGKLKYDRVKLMNRIAKLKNVNLTDGFLDYKEIRQIYLSNDVLVLPYKQVTQCGPLLVGYADDVPVICSDLPGFREYVDDNKSGLIFNGTAEDLAQKMIYFISDPEVLNQIRNYIHTEIYKKFSMKYLVNTYMNILYKFLQI